jgi:exopolysaccharide biosynthesis protein
MCHVCIISGRYETSAAEYRNIVIQNSTYVTTHSYSNCYLTDDQYIITRLFISFNENTIASYIIYLHFTVVLNFK